MFCSWIKCDKKERVHLQNFVLTGRPNLLSYSVDSINLKYRCNRWYDSHGAFSIGFRTKNLATLILKVLNFWILKPMVKTL